MAEPTEPRRRSAWCCTRPRTGRPASRCVSRGWAVWLTQAHLAELYQTTPQNITLHLRAIYEDGELSEGATCKSHIQVRGEGARRVRPGCASTS